MAHHHSSPADPDRRPPPPEAKGDPLSPRRPSRQDPPDRPLRVESNTTKGENPTGKLDPAVGVSILVVTMVVMVIFGRISAILCLLASFYLLPLLREPAMQLTDEVADCGEDTIVDEEEIPKLDVDLDSEEHKKRVVLEGLLQRKGQRRPYRPLLP